MCHHYDKLLLDIKSVTIYGKSLKVEKFSHLLNYSTIGGKNINGYSPLDIENLKLSNTSAVKHSWLPTKLQNSLFLPLNISHIPYDR